MRYLFQTQTMHGHIAVEYTKYTQYPAEANLEITHSMSVHEGSNFDNVGFNNIHPWKGYQINLSLPLAKRRYFITERLNPTLMRISTQILYKGMRMIITI